MNEPHPDLLPPLSLLFVCFESKSCLPIQLPALPALLTPCMHIHGSILFACQRPFDTLRQPMHSFHIILARSPLGLVSTTAFACSKYIQ